MHPITETERLLIREVHPDDTPALFDIYRRPEVNIYRTRKTLTQPEESAALIKECRFNYDAYGYGRWVIVRKSDNTIIGMCGLRYRPAYDHTDIGYNLVPEAWGQGYGTEAAAACLDYGFQKLGLPVIYARAMSGNVASVRIFRKCGMEHDACSEVVSGCDVTYFKKNPDAEQVQHEKIILETERLLLRELLPRDARTQFALNEDHEVVKYTGDGPFENPEAAYSFFKDYGDRYKKYGYARWLVADKTNKEIFGWCGLKFNPEDGETDLGFRFHRRHWNKGYASESSFAVMKWGKETAGLKRIIGRARVENHASLHVLEKCGLVFEKEFMEDGEHYLQLAWNA